MEEEVVWCGILKDRFRDVKRKVLIGDISVVGKMDSIWWRDLLLSNNYESLFSQNFSGAVSCVVGNGLDSLF